MWKKIIIDYKPFSQEDPKKLWVDHGIWPAMWIAAKKECRTIPVSAFRCQFSAKETNEILLHVTADSQYRLYCDGQFVATGSEQGDCQNYFFDSYKWNCLKGEHVLVALVFNPGKRGAYSRMGMNSSFLLAAEGAQGDCINTRVGNWDACVVPGIEFDVFYEKSTAVGNGITFDRNRFPVDLERGVGHWNPSVEIESGSNASGRNEYIPGHLLRAATLPPQMDRRIPSAMIVYVGENNRNFYDETENKIEKPVAYAGGKLEFPKNCTRKILFKLDNYYCANTVLSTSGGKGSRISLHWAEALEMDDQGKGNREEFLNRHFFGVGDCFIPRGNENENFFTLHYRAGRYLELKIKTTDFPLIINSLELWESRYPLDVAANFKSHDSCFDKFFVLAKRTLEMCMHDTYMDCPFYEQLMYIGDSRLQMLVNYTLSADARLAEKSLMLFAASILPSGFLPSRYPSRVTQIIPPFNFFYPAMVCDYVKYRNSPNVTAKIVPVARRVLDNFERYLTSDHLLKLPMGWGFVDWIPRWTRDGKMGTPEGAEFGVSGVLNALYLYSLGQACELHELLGEVEIAARYRRLGKRLAEAMFKTFFSPEFSMLSDCATHPEFSEHSQCLALLSNLLSPEQETFICKGLFSGLPEMAETTFYFDFYYLEACHKAKRMDFFYKRISKRFQSLDELGLKTILERPEPSRSDCHAWSSHIIYHYFASVLGIRPVAAGFKQVEIAPHPGNLTRVSAEMPIPQGLITIDWQKKRKESPLIVQIPSDTTRIQQNSSLCGCFGSHPHFTKRKPALAFSK